MADPVNLSPARRDEIFGPLVIESTSGRDTVHYATPPGPPPLVDVAFGRRTVKVHELAADSLRAIAAEMARDGVIDAVETIVGWQPRLVRTAGGGNTPELSAHAYGAAVDVNAATNPQGSHATPEQAELAAYFEPHGWFWGERFTTPDPHHFAFQGFDPILGDVGLRCPVNAEVFGRDNRIELFPGRIQRWVLTVRGEPSATPEQLAKTVFLAFGEWVRAGMFPGRVGQPTVIVPPAQRGEPTGVWTLREPQHLVQVEFAYLGNDSDMALPTLVQRRRERLDATCPVEPFDVVPLEGLPPGRQITRISDPVEAPDREVTNDLDVLPPVDELAERARDAASSILFGVVLPVGLAAGAIWFLTKRRR